MSNLAVRALSAIVMLVVIYGALILSPHTRWAAISLILSLGAWEFARMATAKLAGPAGTAWISAAAAFLYAIPHYPGLVNGSISLSASPSIWLWGVSISTVLVFTLLGFRRLDIANMAPWIYIQLFGCAYFGIYAAATFGLLDDFPGWKGIFPLIMVQIAIATADTGAYFSGRKFGRNKLAPSISSGKTVEGAVGGAILTIAITLILGPLLLNTGLLANLGLGLVLSATAIMGDLFISILKRYAGFKDSSRLIPGHGGILDRFDALFFSAPAAVFYLHLVR